MSLKRYPISLIIPTIHSPSSFRELIYDAANQVDEVLVVKHTPGQKTLRKRVKHLYVLIELDELKAAKRRNLGVQLSKNQILGFTDDDCILDKSWAKTAYKSFKNNQKISCVTGKIKPYLKTKKPNYICLSTFDGGDIPKRISKPQVHYRHIGLGNNLVVKRSTVIEIGGYKEWLGRGSICSDAEDADLLLTLLQQKKIILYNPLLIVFHNKWVSQENLSNHLRNYDIGGACAYSYHLVTTSPSFFSELRCIFQNRLAENMQETKRQKSSYLEKILYFIIHFSVDLIILTRNVTIGLLTAFLYQLRQV